MKRKLLVAVPLLCVVALLAWYFRPKHEVLGEAYVSERSVTLWSSVAQVREQLGVLGYGEHVDVMSRRNENVKVRTAAGVVGWVDGRYLMEPELWQRSAKLLKQVESIPVQARGRTKVPTNLRVEPGRTEPRLYQFSRNTPMEVVGRATADWVQVTDDQGEHPQYLVAATKGPEGGPCDFTTTRVYTWNSRKSRYETAFIDNNLCGAFPIRTGKDAKGEPEFRFHIMGEPDERVYRLIQTVVRRVKQETSPGKHRPEKSKPTEAPKIK